jgi:hypothetical protein
MEQMFQLEGYWGEGVALDAVGAAVVLRVGLHCRSPAHPAHRAFNPSHRAMTVPSPRCLASAPPPCA